MPLKGEPRENWVFLGRFVFSFANCDFLWLSERFDSGMIEYLYGTWLLCLIALLVYVLVDELDALFLRAQNSSTCDFLSFSLLQKNQHKMFYKTKSTARRSSGTATVTEPNDGLSELIQKTQNLLQKVNKLDWSTSKILVSLLGSQQFYIYSIDGRTGHSPPNAHLDLPPKYEDVIKDTNYVRREVS